MVVRSPGALHRAVLPLEIPKSVNRLGHTMTENTVNSVNSASAVLLATLGAIMFIQHLTDARSHRVSCLLYIFVLRYLLLDIICGYLWNDELI